MSESREHKNAFTQAVDLVKERYRTASGDRMTSASLQHLLGCSHAWFYRCMQSGTTSLPTALRLEVLTDKEFRWQDLVEPSVKDDILRVKDRVETL